MNPQDPTLITPSQPAPPTQPVVVPGQVPIQPIQPEAMFQPITPPVPAQPPSQFSPAEPVQPITNLPKPKKKSKKPLIIGVSTIVLLFVITGAAIALGGTKKQANTPQQQTAAPEGPQPAAAIDVEQANNSIGQDVTGLDNNKDFPSAELDDKTLGL